MDETEHVKQVPTNVLSFIIGRKSSNINLIARECDVRIRVLRRRNEMPKIQRVDRKIPIVINGTTKSVLKALTLIENCIQDYENITARKNNKKSNKASSTGFPTYSSENNGFNNRNVSSVSKNNDSHNRDQFDKLCQSVMQNELKQWPSNVEYQKVPPQNDNWNLEKSKSKKFSNNLESYSNNSFNGNYERRQTKTSDDILEIDNMVNDTDQSKNKVVETYPNRKLDINDVVCDIFGENSLVVRDMRLRYKDKIIIKNDLIGLAIGTRGENINKARSVKDIEEIQIISDKELCIIEGRTYESVRNARSILEFRNEILKIPREYVDYIFGNKNRKYLEKITIVRKENMDTISGIVQLTGTVTNIARAKIILMDKYPGLNFILKTDSIKNDEDFLKEKRKDLMVNVYSLNRGKFESEKFFITDIIESKKVFVVSNDIGTSKFVSVDRVKLPHDENVKYNFAAGDCVKIFFPTGFQISPMTNSMSQFEPPWISIKILSVCRESNSVKYFCNGQVCEVPFDYVGHGQNDVAFYKFDVKITPNFKSCFADIFSEFLTAIEASYCFLDEFNGSLRIISRVSWSKEKTKEIYPIFARIMKRNADKNSEKTVAKLFCNDDVSVSFGTADAKTTYARLSECMKNQVINFPTTLNVSDPPSFTTNNISVEEIKLSLSHFDAKLKNLEPKSETVSSVKAPEKNFPRKYSGVKIAPRESFSESKTEVQLSTSTNSSNGSDLSSRFNQSITRRSTSSKDTSFYPTRKLSCPYDPQKATRKSFDYNCCLS